MNQQVPLFRLAAPLMVAVAIFSNILFSSNVFAAFVPVTEETAVSKKPAPKSQWETMHELASMDNKEIEALTGKKLTLKEKIGLSLLRRKMKKEGFRQLATLDNFEDKCFTMYLKNGDVLEVKIIQIGTSEIKYQRCNKPNDPEIVISKAEVFNIKDGAGEVIFSSKGENWSKGRSDGETDRLALASGIIGIGALTLGLLFWPLGMAAGITAGIMGISAMRRFKNNRNLRGEGWAITGIVAGGLWVFIGTLLLIALSSWWW